MNNSPVQPTDKLLEELGKRVAYKALLQLDAMLVSPGAQAAAAPMNLEKMDTLANIVACASSVLGEAEAPGGFDD